jgi:pantetheine-phosphate adenylyltransferase
MTERIALYPGSFDPPTLGHRDLVQRARDIFDRVIVGVAENTRKQQWFTAEERVAMMREMTAEVDGVEVTSFNTLTVDFARKRGAIAVIRGLRVISDFEYELSMAINNQKLNPDLETVCLMPSEQYLFLSSQLVKEVAKFDGPLDHFVTEAVAERLRERLRERE